MSYCVRSTCRQAHLCVFQLKEIVMQGILQNQKASIEDIKGKWSNVCSGKCNSLCCSPLSLCLCLLFCLLFLSASPDCGVPSRLFSREIQLTCRGLKDICSAHQVSIMLLFLWTAPENVKQTKKQNIWIYLLTTILYARATRSHWFNAEGLFPTWLKRLSRTISYQICFDTNIVEQINVMTTLSEQ